jgi:hypothetical protein
MKIKEQKGTNIYYDALVLIYNKAINNGIKETEELEEAFNVLETLVNGAETFVTKLIEKTGN